MGIFQEADWLKKKFFDRAQDPATLEIGTDTSAEALAYQQLRRVG